MASYRVLVYDTDVAGSTWGPTTLLAEFENPKNVGYASYLNDIGEAFWTVNQRDIKVDLRDYIGIAHVVIIRMTHGVQDVVWRGLVAEIDANEEDVIFYAYDYLHLLYMYYTQWNKVWKNKQIAGASGRPVDDLWAQAKARPDSLLNWITTGTLQSPYTTNARDVNIVLNEYRVNFKKVLTCFRELVALAVSDTDNVVYMEMDFPSSPADLSATFNFWKHRTADVTRYQLTYPGNVLGFNDRYVPITTRNKLLGVGQGPRGQVYRFNCTAWSGGPYSRNDFGQRMEPLFLTWVRDRKELKRIVRRRLKKAQRGNVDLYVRMYPGTIPPWRSTEGPQKLGDRIYVDLDDGITRIQQWMWYMGEQVVFIGGREYVQPILESTAGYSEEEEPD